MIVAVYSVLACVFCFVIGYFFGALGKTEDEKKLSDERHNHEVYLKIMKENFLIKQSDLKERLVENFKKEMNRFGISHSDMIHICENAIQTENERNYLKRGY